MTGHDLDLEACKRIPHPVAKVLVAEVESLRAKLAAAEQALTETSDGSWEYEKRYNKAAIRGDRAQVCDTQSLRSALIEAIHTATRHHGLAPTGTDHCLCGGWVEGDDWDEHLAPVSLDAILPLIADAIEADAHALKHRITAASADLGRPLARTMLSEVDGRILAARLVRSLLGTDSDR